MIADVDLSSFHLPIYSEEALQEAIARVFDETGIRYEREVRLSERDRIDFMLGSLGIEVKIEGSVHQVTRQLQRYAQYDRVGSLLLVTSRSKLSAVPRELSGKRVDVQVLFGSML